MSVPGAACFAPPSVKAASSRRPEFSFILDGGRCRAFRLRIFWPSALRTIECNPDPPEGNLAGKLDPIMIMRATQKKSMSYAVNQQARPDSIFRKSGVSSGQPIVEKGPQRGTEPGLEHIRSLRQLGRAAMRALPRSLTRDGNLFTIAAMPGGGNPMPPHSWREMQHKSRMLRNPLQIFGAPVFRQDHDVAALRRQRWQALPVGLSSTICVEAPRR